MLLFHRFFFGSPTNVLYRATSFAPAGRFYTLGRLHEDTEAAYEILLENDFGFVHEILSFMRTDNESLTSAARRFNADPLDYVITLERYGPRF